MTPDAIEFTARDGAPLVARWFPAAEPRGTVVIAGATAVPQGYYRQFAAFLAGRGLSVLTFDYRGVGLSRRGSLRGFAATLRDWGERDLPAAMDLAEARGVGPLLYVGHSFGGQALGLAPAVGRVAGVVTVGAQLGWVGHWPTLLAWKHRLLLGGAIPLANAAFGYVPGWLGLGEDLPAGVAAEWARWCLSPGYLLDHVPWAREAYARLDAPVRLYAVTDDTYAPLRAVKALARLLPVAEIKVVTPAEVGARRLGHFGPFRPAARVLWDEIATTLLARGRAA